LARAEQLWFKRYRGDKLEDAWTEDCTDNPKHSDSRTMLIVTEAQHKPKL